MNMISTCAFRKLNNNSKYDDILDESELCVCK